VDKEEIETDDISVFLAESHGKYLMDSHTTMYKMIQKNVTTYMTVRIYASEHNFM
jgi:hypothetical protein